MIQALITAPKQLRCLQFTKGKDNERMNVEEGPKGVRLPLLTTTFGVVFHIFPIDFPHCCHTFDDSYHALYVTNL